jgi:hypothetical protein
MQPNHIGGADQGKHTVVELCFANRVAKVEQSIGFTLCIGEFGVIKKLPRLVLDGPLVVIDCIDDTLCQLGCVTQVQSRFSTVATDFYNALSAGYRIKVFRESLTLGLAQKSGRGHGELVEFSG